PVIAADRRCGGVAPRKAAQRPTPPAHDSTSRNPAVRVAMSSSVFSSVAARISRSARSARSGQSRLAGTPASTPRAASMSTTGAAGTGRRTVSSLKKHRVSTRSRIAGRPAGGARVVELRQPGEPGFAQQRHVNGEGERAETGIGANVAGRLLSADMLLAGRERQHEAAPSLDVTRLANDPSRHLAHEFLAHGE